MESLGVEPGWRKLVTEVAGLAVYSSTLVPVHSLPLDLLTQKQAVSYFLGHGHSHSLLCASAAMKHCTPVWARISLASLKLLIRWLVTRN